MSRKDLQQCVQQLAERYGWKHYPKRREALGMHRGVGVHALEHDGELSLLFFAPGSNVGDEILEHFQGFRHSSDFGLQPSWFRGRTEDDCSCLLFIDAEQLEQVGRERFLEVPDVVARDFHAHGAAEELPCQQCGERPAAEVALVGVRASCLCPLCWQLLRIQTPGGRLETANREVQWGKVLPWLLGAVVLGGLFWGWLFADVRQRPQRFGPWVLFVPLLFG